MIYNILQERGELLVAFYANRGSALKINVMIACSNMLFSSGIAKILENDKIINVTEVLQAGTNCSDEQFEAINPDVVLVDFTTLYNAFSNHELVSKNKFILIDTDCGRDNIVSAILKKQLSGVLLGDSTAAHLKKAIKAVANDEIWIDKTTVKNLLYGVNALKKNKTAKLSEKEKEVVSLVSQGFTNKEAAKKLHISEPTVKTHLSHIFRKLAINNRTQLVTYAIKNQDVNLASF
jgi:DNA-binding NarL/FixJ family response regulator